MTHHRKYLSILLILLFCISTLPIHQCTTHTLSQQNKTTTVPILVYTAIQEWPSKSWIYLLTLDGTPITHYEYEWYLFNDIEIVNNNLYAADWIAPCLYHINLTTGALTQIINDISLLYMYDVAFDGTYFYLKEWNLNRYDINGNKESSIPFQDDLRGSTFDSQYYWTLNTTADINCYNIDTWPTITELPANHFRPPSTSCRGLYHDGTTFWSAEHTPGTGYIYQFSYNGSIITQLPEPHPYGYAAAPINYPDEPPHTPPPPTGPTNGHPHHEYTFETSTTDPENHKLYYQWNWGNNTLSPWYGPYPSGTTHHLNHSWPKPDSYHIQTRAKDIYGAETPWSPPHTITIAPNQPPLTPTITGTTNGKAGVAYTYTLSNTQDPEDDSIYAYWDWGDGTVSDWQGPYQSGEPISATHTWTTKGSYTIKAKLKDTWNNESNWATLPIQMPTHQHTQKIRTTYRFQILKILFNLEHYLINIGLHHIQQIGH